MHENLDRDHAVEGPSDRSFGVTFAVVLSLFAALSYWKSGDLWPYLIGAGGLFGLAALLRPGVLAPLNRLWMKFGLVLHKVMTPLIMGLLFFGVMMPFGVVMRLSGKNLLGLKPEGEKASYWVERNPAGPDAASMPNQF